MTSPWVLLLTDDPSVTTTTRRLADAAGIVVRQPEARPAVDSSRARPSPDGWPAHAPTADAGTPQDRGDGDWGLPSWEFGGWVLGDQGGGDWAGGDRAGGDWAAGAGLPSLVLLGADRLSDRTLPPEASGVPRILLSAGEPSDRLWRAAMELRAEQVVLLPEAENALLDRLTRLAEQRPRQALTIAVLGGCGGAGASVLAAALARSATAVARSLLIDVDPLGGGADLLLGAEDEPGLRWPDLASARGRLLPGSLAGAIPVIDGMHVLSWDRAPGPSDLSVAAGSAVFDAARHEYGVVVLDLPRHLDAVAVAAARAADLGLLVVPAEVRAAAASRRVLTTLQEHLADVRLVVRISAPTGLRAEAISDALGLPLAGVLKPEPGLRVALDRGDPPGLRRRGPLSVLCRDFLARTLVDAQQDRGPA